MDVPLGDPDDIVGLERIRIGLDEIRGEEQVIFLHDKGGLVVGADLEQERLLNRLARKALGGRGRLRGVDGIVSPCELNVAVAATDEQLEFFRNRGYRISYRLKIKK